jgi:hypothetical protein
MCNLFRYWLHIETNIEFLRHELSKCLIGLRHLLLEFQIFVKVFGGMSDISSPCNKNISFFVLEYEILYAYVIEY